MRLDVSIEELPMRLDVLMRLDASSEELPLRPDAFMTLDALREKLPLLPDAFGFKLWEAGLLLLLLLPLRTDAVRVELLEIFFCFDGMISVSSVISRLLLCRTFLFAAVEVC